MSAIVEANGDVRQLDSKAGPTEQLTENLATDPLQVAQTITSIRMDLAALKRRWWPKEVTIRDREVDATGTTVYRFSHNFGGRVHWHPCDWTGASGPQLARHASTDDNTLALVSYAAGRVSLHIEEGG